MNDISNYDNEKSNLAITKLLSVRKKSVAKHHNNKIPFKKMQPLKKKSGLTNKMFILEHHQLNQTIVKI